MQEIRPLTRLRGLAALAVLVFHVNLFWPAPPPGSVRSIAVAATHHGWAGVDLFFVLSGFLLAAPYWRRAEGPSVGRFLLRRWWRIGPPYYAALLFSVVLTARWQDFVAPPRALPQYLLFVQNFTPDTLAHFNPVFWTIAIEFQFYVMLPFVVRLMRAAPRLTSAGMFAVALAWRWWTFPGPDGSWAPWPGLQVFPFFGHFAAGLLASRLWATGRTLPGNPWAWLLAPSVAVLLAFVAAGPWDGIAQTTQARLPYTWVRPFIAVCFALVLWSAANRWPSHDRAPRPGPAIWVGRAAYTIYLVHLPVLLLVDRLPGLGSKTSPPLFFGAGLIAVALAAAAFYWTIERPSVQRSRRISPMSQIPEPQPATPPPV